MIYFLHRIKGPIKTFLQFPYHQSHSCFAHCNTLKVFANFSYIVSCPILFKDCHSSIYFNPKFNQYHRHR